jgi:hypothetical protein
MIKSIALICALALTAAAPVSAQDSLFDKNTNLTHKNEAVWVATVIEYGNRITGDTITYSFPAVTGDVCEKFAKKYLVGDDRIATTMKIICMNTATGEYFTLRS